ncbi:hypothetical protein PUN28_019092 [Cardiocondyla obscurior]|uniref:Uncharacterized protein n=1 Tax=Cardiocondyla obscurior TaxID=286306 RepID=A0AAW2EHF5_9HYME
MSNDSFGINAKIIHQALLRRAFPACSGVVNNAANVASVEPAANGNFFLIFDRRGETLVPKLTTATGSANVTREQVYVRISK